MILAKFAKTFLLLLTLALLSSCGSKTEGEFSKDELAWLVYPKSKGLEFKNTEGTLHQFEVTDRTDLEQIKTYFPIEAEVIINNQELDSRFQIYLLKDVNSFKRYFKLGEVYRSLDMLTPIPSMSIAGKNYSEVYRIKEDTTGGKMGIWMVDFNQTKGILRYFDRETGAYVLAK